MSGIEEKVFRADRPSSHRLSKTHMYMSIYFPKAVLLLLLRLRYSPGLAYASFTIRLQASKPVGSNPAEAVGFLGRKKKSSARLPSEGK